MPRTPAPPPPDRTPQARLTESELHGVLGYQLAQASIVTLQVYDAEVGSRFELRPVEYTLLTLVHANPDVTARQLARGLAVTPPNITVLIDRLVARGLVGRTRSASDARVQHLRATEAGVALASQATQRLLEGEGAALAGLSAAERGMLIELLHKVALARGRSTPA